ncbi:hypothetical protein SUDANB126_00687 [Streptomyces sp. enrichment culture]
MISGLPVPHALTRTREDIVTATRTCDAFCGLDGFGTAGRDTWPAPTGPVVLPLAEGAHGLTTCP